MKTDRFQVLRQAQSLIAAGDLRGAERLYATAIGALPKDVALRLARSRLLTRQMGRADLAMADVLACLKLAPGRADVQQEAAEVHFRNRQMADAERHAELAAKLGAKNPDALYVAATVFDQLERYNDAALALGQVLALAPDHRPARTLYAKTIRSLGRLDDAADLCRTILTETPENLSVYGIYSNSTKLTADDPHMRHLETVILPQLTGPKNHTRRANALKYLAKARLDIGDHDAAFDLFTQAKALSDVKHDRGKQRAFVAGITSGVTRTAYFGRTGSADETPVLVVGMPRVGSTLLEQVLASHPDIGSIGESKSLRGVLGALKIPSGDGATMARAITTLTDDQARDLAGKYSAFLTDKQPGKARVVNKFLHNFEMLGLFGRMFPKGRILHATRDPLDNCVSCYLQNLSDWHSYTLDLGALGQYYREHRALMDHWRRVLPNPILEVRYEDMVADTEGMSRTVIDFLGLPWNDACLNYREAENRAKTLSVWQVRQPVYATSVKRWKRYERHLDPLKAELTGFYPDGF